MFGFFNRPRPYRTPTLELSNLDQTGLELEWLKTKEELVLTNYYKSSDHYTEISIRASEVLPRILASYCDIFDQRKVEIHKFTKLNKITRESIFIEHEGFIKKYGHHAMLSIAFYCFCGRIGPSGSKLHRDHDLIRSTVDSLILEKMPLAFFLKGIILKHGLYYPVPPDTTASKKYLIAAKNMNIAEASVEINTLQRYRHLSELKPANSLSEEWSWV